MSSTTAQPAGPPDVAPSWLPPRLVALARASNAALAVAVAGICIEWLAAVWDIAWHYEIGRDRFLTPPHAAMVAGGVILGAGPDVVLRLAGRPSAGWWNRERPGLALASWAAVLQGVSLVIDNWWHNTFGVDVSLWSPPHLALILLWWIAMVALMGDYARGPQRRDGVLVAWIGLFLATTTIVLSEYDFGGSHFRVLWAPAILAALAVGGVTMARRSTGLRWAGTAAAAVAVAARLAPDGLNAVLHRAVPGLPLGILAAGIVVDLVDRRGDRRWGLAAGGLAAVAVVAVEFPWLDLTGKTRWPHALVVPAVVVAVLGAWLGVVAGGGIGAELAQVARTADGSERRPAQALLALAACLALVAAIVGAAAAFDPAPPLGNPIVVTATASTASIRAAVHGLSDRDAITIFHRRDGDLVWIQHGDHAWVSGVAAPAGSPPQALLLRRAGATAPHPVAPWLTPVAYLAVIILLAGTGALAYLSVTRGQSAGDGRLLLTA